MFKKILCVSRYPSSLYYHLRSHTVFHITHRISLSYHTPYFAFISHTVFRSHPFSSLTFRLWPYNLNVSQAMYWVKLSYHKTLCTQTIKSWCGLLKSDSFIIVCWEQHFSSFCCCCLSIFLRWGIVMWMWQSRWPQVNEQSN